MSEATIHDLTHPGWRDEEITRLRAKVERLTNALKKIESGYYDQFGEPKKIAQEALRS